MGARYIFQDGVWQRLHYRLEGDIEYCNAVSAHSGVHLWDIYWNDEAIVPYEVHIERAGSVRRAFITLPDRQAAEVFNEAEFWMMRRLRMLWTLLRLVVL